VDLVDQEVQADLEAQVVPVRLGDQEAQVDQEDKEDQEVQGVQVELVDLADQEELQYRIKMERLFLMDNQEDVEGL